MGDPHHIQLMERIGKVEGRELWVLPIAKLSLPVYNYPQSPLTANGWASSVFVHGGEIHASLTTSSLVEFKLPDACFVLSITWLLPL